MEMNPSGPEVDRVVVVPTHLGGRKHLAGDLQVAEGPVIALLRKHDALDVRGDRELVRQPQVLVLELVVEIRDLLVGLLQADAEVELPLADPFDADLECKGHEAGAPDVDQRHAKAQVRR